MTAEIASLTASYSQLTTENASLKIKYKKLDGKYEKLQIKYKSLVKKSKASVSINTGSWKKAKVSWYGPGFYGNHTASGKVLTKNMMNFAHKTMKFGTKVMFSYKGKTVTAVCNDRGPYVAGRTFDLGPGTAKALGFSGVGTVKWKVVK